MCCECNYFLKGMDFMPNIHLLVDTYWMQPFDFGFYSIDKTVIPSWLWLLYLIWFYIVISNNNWSIEIYHLWIN